MSPVVDRFSEILRGTLWQSGSAVDYKEVQAARINAIIAVGGGEQTWIAHWRFKVNAEFMGRPQSRMSVYVRAPLVDSSHCLDVDSCEATVGLVLRLLRDPERRILVHCDMGAFRSVHVTACVVAV